MPWDATAAVTHLNANAGSVSTGNCARYTREAVQAGGIVLSRTTHAKDYGTSLTSSGFAAVTGTNYQAGDVVIIQPPDGTGSGHMAMYNGTAWVSDFTQTSLYPGSSYRTAQPAYVVYRHP